MKPKNKLQKEVLDLSRKLAPVTEKQKQYAYEHSFENIGKKIKKGITCMVCGHTWKDNSVNKKCTCPNCQKKLIIEETRKRIFEQSSYFSIITTCKGYQVQRYFVVNSYVKAGEAARYSCYEVVQQWVNPNGKYATIARLRSQGFFRKEPWDYSSSFEIRPNLRREYYYYGQDYYNIKPDCIYPVRKYIPEIKRNGFQGNFHGYTPLDMFTSILTDSKTETLLKAGQFALLRYIRIHRHCIDKYWASIKICLRNNYIIKKADIWKDYMDMLDYFSKDLRNAKYVCPEDLMTEHNYYATKKEALSETEAAQITITRNEEKFKAMKEPFFNLVFTDKLIRIEVLRSVKEFAEEGKAMHHCVFTSAYYLKENSLILSARIKGKRIETIEIALDKMCIVQSRGVLNKYTKYHERIIKLVEQNFDKIEKCMLPAKKRSAA